MFRAEVEKIAPGSVLALAAPSLAAAEAAAKVLPPTLPGSANVTITPLDIGDIPQAPSNLDEADLQKPGHKGLGDES